MAKKKAKKVKAKGRAKRKKSMTKSQFLSTLSEKTEMSKKEVSNFIDTIVSVVYEQATKNGVVIPGLGKLVIVERKARIGRNPATGETIKIPKRKALKFKIAKVAKDKLAPRNTIKSKKKSKSKTKKKNKK